MGGFKNEDNNIALEYGLFRSIILHIFKCCNEMKQDCQSSGTNLHDHEDKITNRLVERYLNKKYSGFKYLLQRPENYDACTDTHVGITDITVVSSDWFSNINPNAYYIIECKRIDGSNSLNKAYVEGGIYSTISQIHIILWSKHYVGVRCKGYKY